jgi:hypothetical protein
MQHVSVYFKLQLNSAMTSLKGTEYFASLYTSVVLNEKHIFEVNSDELIGTTESLTL